MRLDQTRKIRRIGDRIIEERRKEKPDSPYKTKNRMRREERIAGEKREGEWTRKRERYHMSRIE